VLDSRVALITDDSGFARELLSRWQQESGLPGLKVMHTDHLTAIGEGNFDLVIVGAVRSLRLASVLTLMDAADCPLICLLDSAADVKMAKAARPRFHFMLRHEAWSDSILSLAIECLKRTDLAARVRRAEQSALASSRGAALGRCVLESRHDLNNSLTSVLGNAELLLLDADALPPAARDQLETIHEMALQIHEILRRFSSVATEAPPTESSSQDETKFPSLTTTTIH
jgi:signal transduction histidine kinase